MNFVPKPNRRSVLKGAGFIAMSFAIAALRAATEIRILDCDHVATSFPGFDALARGLGLQISAMTD
mgnify:CR=1 FL=1